PHHARPARFRSMAKLPAVTDVGVTSERSDRVRGRSVVVPSIGWPFRNVWPLRMFACANVGSQILPGAPFPPRKSKSVPSPSSGRHDATDAEELSDTTQNTVRIPVSRVVKFRTSLLPSNRSAGSPFAAFGTSSGRLAGTV